MSSNKNGKKIERIHIGEKKVILKFSDSKLDISKTAYLELTPYEGKILTDDDIKNFKKIDELDKYLTYAKKLVLSSFRSEKEIIDKLASRGAKPRQITYIIKELKKCSLIDDSSLMNELIENANYKNYGEERIRKILFEKGISKELINKYKFTDKDELVKARRYLASIEKKFSKYNNLQKRKHILQALLMHGFNYEISHKILTEVKDNDSNSELDALRKDYIKVKNRYIKKYNKDEVDYKINQYLLSKGYKYSNIEKIKGEKLWK